MFPNIFIIISIWSLIIQNFSSFNINFNQSNDDIQLQEAIQAINKSNDQSNCLYIYQNITIKSVHNILNNMIFL